MGLFQLRVLSFGLVFLLTMLSVSYKLYHLNNFKILLSFLGVACLFLLFDFIPFIFKGWKKKNSELTQREDGLTVFQVIFYSLMPLLACLPGLFTFGDFIPFFTSIEVFSVIVPVVWMAYLYRELKTINLWEKFIFWISLTTLLASLWGVLEYFGLHPDNLYPALGGGIRAKSTFGNINYFAGYLVVVLPFLTQLFIAQFLRLKAKEKERIISQTFLGTVVFFGILALHFTKTRAALVGFYGSFLMCGFYWMFAEGYKNKIKIRWKSFSIIPALLGVGGILLFTFSKIARIGSLEGSLLARLFSWESAVRSIIDAPILGYGPGTSYQLFFDFRNPNFRLFTGESSFRHAHSEILELLQEGGLLGLSVSVLFWGIIFHILYNVWKRPSEDPSRKRPDGENLKLRYLAFALGASFIAYFAHATFSVAPRMMVVKLPLYTLIGMTFFLSQYSSFKGLPIRVPDWWDKFLYSLSSSRRQFFGFFLLVGFSLWGLNHFIPSQYTHYKLLSSPTNPKTIKSFEKTVTSDSSPYFLGHLVSRQFRLGRIKELEASLGQLESMFPNWRDQKYRMAIFNYKKGKVKEATSLALGFQKISDAYYRPNINFLMDMAKVTNNYPLFKEELKYLLRMELFEHKLYLERKEENIVFKNEKKNSFIGFEEKDGKVYGLLNDDILKSLFYKSIDLRKKKGTKAYHDQLNQFKRRVTALLDRSQYFGMRVKKNVKEKPQDIRKSVINYFQLEQQKKNMIQSKRHFFHKEMKRVSRELSAKGSHPYYIKMKVNLIKRKQEKVIRKLNMELDKRSQVLVSYLKKVTDWDKVLRKIELKKKILKIFYRLPL